MSVKSVKVFRETRSREPWAARFKMPRFLLSFQGRTTLESKTTARCPTAPTLEPRHVPSCPRPMPVRGRARSSRRTPLPVELKLAPRGGGQAAAQNNRHGT